MTSMDFHIVPAESEEKNIHPLKVTLSYWSKYEIVLTMVMGSSIEVTT